MNPKVLPFIIVPLLAIGAGLALILWGATGHAHKTTLLVVGILLAVIGAVLPVLFFALDGPPKSGRSGRKK